MSRATLLAVLILAAGALPLGQQLPVVDLAVAVRDADGRALPVARHALLISDNPPVAAPRLVTTTPDGTAQVRLPPGSYIIESERPVVVYGQSYEWVQTFTVAAGRSTRLTLTAENAIVGLPVAGAASGIAVGTKTSETPPVTSTTILMNWQASTFGLWTPVTHAGGFLIDGQGLVATSLRAIGGAKRVDVQISRALKVAGDVTVAHAADDVAIVRVHPSAVQELRPVPLACDAVGDSPSDGDRYVIEARLFGATDIGESLIMSPRALGGPVFGGDGRALGFASPMDQGDTGSRVEAKLVGLRPLCDALAAARTALGASAAPTETPLPVESVSRRPAAATGTSARTFSLSPYQTSTSDFDVTFLTPQVLEAAEGRRGWTGGRLDELNGLRIATDFGRWADYVTSAPPLLYVRVTPRLVEGFWMKVARGAASTQGANIPPILRLRPGFAHLSVVCGDKDLLPVHPFTIRSRITESEAMDEGFYVFDPAAIGPHCGGVSVRVSSAKDPARIETRTVDPAIVRRVWDDFASVR